MHIWPTFAPLKISGNFVGCNEFLQHAKDLDLILKHYKIIHVIAIF